MEIWNGSGGYSWWYRADTILPTDGQTDGGTDGLTRWNQYTPLSTSMKPGGGGTKCHRKSKICCSLAIIGCLFKDYVKYESGGACGFCGSDNDGQIDWQMDNANCAIPFGPRWLTVKLYNYLAVMKWITTKCCFHWIRIMNEKIVVEWAHRSLLLTWINLNPSMDKKLHPLKVWDEMTYPLPNLNRVTVEVWEWINNFIPHFMGHVMLGLKLAHWGLVMPYGDIVLGQHWLR